MSIPLQQNMDMTDPEEHALWALVNIGGDIGAPLLLPVEVMRHWSRHLYECGFRHHPDLQTRWYEPPTGEDSIWHGAGGKWVDHEPDTSDPVGELVDKMSPAMKAELLARLKREDGPDDGSVS